MIYDVFIFNGTVFDMDPHFVKLCDLTWQEAATIVKAATRQEELDCVIRAAQEDS